MQIDQDIAGNLLCQEDPEQLFNKRPNIQINIYRKSTSNVESSISGYGIGIKICH